MRKARLVYLCVGTVQSCVASFMLFLLAQLVRDSYGQLAETVTFAGCVCLLIPFAILIEGE
jgi:hypothetical protein